MLIVIIIVIIIIITIVIVIGTDDAIDAANITSLLQSLLLLPDFINVDENTTFANTPFISSYDFFDFFDFFDTPLKMDSF